MKAPQPKYNSHLDRRAFTLIELLVVIALTAILFTLVFAPLINTLNLTSRANTQIETQSAARDIMRQIQATLSGAVFVYDNASQGLSNPNGQLGDPDGRINLWLYGPSAGYDPVSGANYNPISNGPLLKTFRYSMIEYVEPASQSESGAGTAVDPTTGKPFPAQGAPINVALPLIKGRTIVRLFPGLLYNASGPTTLKDSQGNTLSGMPVDSKGNYLGYANKFDDAQDVSPARDNRVTLYKAEIQPFIPDPNNAGKYVPNIALFHTINSAGQKSLDPTSSNIILDDPNFFYDTTPVPAAYVSLGAPGVEINGRATVPMWECWKAVSQSLLIDTKADILGVERDDRNRIVYRDNNGLRIQDTGSAAPFTPATRPLITFTPQYVENDPGVPANLVNTGAETPYAAATQFRAQYGAWCRPYRVFVYRAPDTDQTQDPLSYVDPTTKLPLFYKSGEPDMGIYFQGGGNNVGPYQVPNPSTTGIFNNPNLQYAFTVDYEKGTVNFAFPHTVYDRDASGFPLPMYYNPSTVNAPADNPNINKRYLWLREFDLTNTLNPTSASSPLKTFYTPLMDPPDPTKQSKPYNVRVVPGSERVFGPDENPGPHYGYRTQYTRVSANAGQVGRNQYRILYENTPNADFVSDVNDPRVQAGYIEFDSLPDAETIGTTSANLSPTDDIPMTHPVSDGNGGTKLAPANYRTHSLPQVKWVPDPSAPTDMTKGTLAAADPVEVSYSFQMNRPTDVVKIDYLTRSIINVNMEMRLYDPRSARPQTTQLTSKVSIRNLQR